MLELKKYYFFISLFLSVINSSFSIKCYTCSYAKSGGIEGQECIDDPDSVSAINKITPCDKKYCSITRQEKSGSNTVESISRTCENKPHKNGKEDDGTSTFYYYSCTKDLCNDGDGKKSKSVDPDSGAGDNMIVKAINGAHHLGFIEFLLILPSFIYILS
ncbi:hypothetical protein ACFFRR_009358 [Megaselia abdita]